MSRKKKEKKAKKQARQARRSNTGWNPLYPEKQESDVKGVLTALGSVAAAIAILAVIVMNYSYFIHPERLEGKTQSGQNTAVAEAGEPSVDQSAAEVIQTPPAETQTETAESSGQPDPGPQDDEHTDPPVSSETTPAPQEEAPESVSEVDIETAEAAETEQGQTQPNPEGQDIESLEGTGVMADGTPNSPAEQQGQQAPPEQTAQQPGQSSGETAAVPQIFADSSTRYLTDAEVSRLSQADIQTAINEIFARHGYIFETAEIYEHFLQYEWYHPTVPKDSFDMEVFSDIEEKNVDLLSRYRR